MRQFKLLSFRPLFSLLLILVFTSGCTRRISHELWGLPNRELGTSIEKGRVAIFFTVDNYLVEDSGVNPDEFVIELLEIELQKRNLCPDGYVIDRKTRSRALDYGLVLDCKK